jgi:hypothetical protein
MSIPVFILILIVLIVFVYFSFGIKENNSALYENDAKRFARLLISELKLFETYKVERGLKNNNLYESLQDEIEEARYKYKKRISNSEFERYFDDALTEILANGDKSKLGIISNSLNK